MEEKGGKIKNAQGLTAPSTRAGLRPLLLCTLQRYKKNWDFARGQVINY